MAEQKRLTRSSDRMVGGVAGGLARYFRIDPVIVRLGFVLLALIQGIGVVVYLLMWLLVPDESSREMTGDDVVRANIEDMRAQVQRLGTGLRGNSQLPMIIGLSLVGLGALFLLHEFFPALPQGFLWPLVLIGVGAYLLLTRR
jgi:phage shock protein C